MKKLWALAFCFLLVSVFFLSCSVDPAWADGEAWADNFAYRKSLEIINATGADTNYQIRLDVNYGSGADSGSSVFLDSNIQADFDDVNFTDNDGETWLDYWREEYTASDDATFWIEVADDLSSSNVTIYLYYGNATCSTSSNGDNTFIFFDDFPGDAYNTDKWDWNGQGSITVAGGVMTVTGGGAADTFILSDDAFPINTRIREKVSFNKIENGYYTTNGYFNVGNDRIYFIFYAGLNRFYSFRAGANSYDVLATGCVPDTYYVFDYRWIPGNCKFLVNDVQKGDKSDNIPSINIKLGLFAGANYGDDEQYCEWIMLGKYVDPEPVCGDWGAEEEPPFNTPFYSDVANSTSERGSNCLFSSYWWIAVDDLSGYIFSFNASGSWANDTWSSFAAANQSWANVSKTLSYTIGTVISWKTFGNSSEDIWNSTGITTFTVQATITFYFTGGGALHRNGSSLGNATSTAYTSPTNLTMLAAADYNYTFLNHTSPETSTTTNPYTYPVDDPGSFWCFFASAGEVEADRIGSDDLAGLMVIALICIPLLFLFVAIRRRKH